MQKISAVLITLNAGEILRTTLQALSWCDELVVVDSGSTDQTLQICQEHGCRVEYRKFTGYGEQKRFAVELASHDWILSVDADEVVTEQLRSEIQAVLSQPAPTHAGYYVRIPLMFLGARIKSEASKKFLRLFNKQYGNYDTAAVHEKVRLNGTLGDLKGEMLHYSYKDIQDYFRKMNQYSTAAAVSLQEKKKEMPFALMVLKCPIAFFKTYLIKGCIWNGVPGFIYSFFSGFYPMMKYAKLWEANHNASNPDKQNTGF
jgi:glycosyltransferase involved in cell wall biosynthesis